MLPDRSHGPLVATVAALVLLVNLGGPALHDEDEPRNAACSATMLDRGDWVVPMFNGRLRTEKPALVNWLQMTGYALAGRNETGARIGGALLSIGTCLLTWRIGRFLHGPAVGLVAGLAMATCVWTAVGGRAATPDAPLVFFTTLALAWFVGGCNAEGIPQLSRRRGLAIGAACGAALLAKGPVGLVLPLVAFLTSGLLLAFPAGSRATGAWHGMVATRPGWIVAAALVVAGPWYAWVTARTDGEWLRGFFLVHNLGRFAGAMEGHCGTWFYYPAVLAVGFFPWSIVLAAVACRALLLAGRPGTPRHRATVITTVWLATWLVAFSASATKLPGYVWPAYPALAVLTGAFLAEWSTDRLPFPGRRADGSRWPDRVLALAWSILVVAGVAGMLAVGLAGDHLPRSARVLALPCGLAAAGGCLCWWSQRCDRRIHSLATLAATAALFTAPLASLGPTAVQAGSVGARHLATSLPATTAADAWVSLGPVPASLVFYTGATIRRVASVAEAVAHLDGRPDGLVFATRGHGDPLTAALPSACDVVHRVPLPFTDDLLVIGRRTVAESLVACQTAPTTP